MSHFVLIPTQFYLVSTKNDLPALSLKWPLQPLSAHFISDAHGITTTTHNVEAVLDRVKLARFEPTAQPQFPGCEWLALTPVGPASTARPPGTRPVQRAPKFRIVGCRAVRIRDNPTRQIRSARRCSECHGSRWNASVKHRGAVGLPATSRAAAKGREGQRWDSQTRIESTFTTRLDGSDILPNSKKIRQHLFRSKNIRHSSTFIGTIIRHRYFRQGSPSCLQPVYIIMRVKY